MSNLLLDEWLWADLAGQNLSSTPASQKETFDFLQAIFRKCDRIVVVRGSAFAEKAMDFWKQAGGSKLLRGFAKYYRANFWENSEKILFVDRENLEALPDELSLQVKPDDQYLVRACLTVEVETLVTTDHPLRDILREKSMSCELREDFVGPYIAKYLDQ